MDKLSSPAREFASALEENAPLYDISLNEQAIARLLDYYELVMAWNGRLHLVAPCPPAEFATRHVLESLLALPFLPPGARVTDVGSGAGLPILPCLIVRPDLRVTLIESSPKKTVFLREALGRIVGPGEARVVAERFEKTGGPETGFITCRALDRFTELFPQLIEWVGPSSTMLLFGGETLREQIEKASLDYQAARVPQSERRFLFIVKPQPRE
jgi:16S rRNA (guanine527-N7)-methyltransferase